jgi:hypothetical protein
VDDENKTGKNVENKKDVEKLKKEIVAWTISGH